MGKYELGFAANLTELKAVQRLRFRVFNEELKEGLDTSRSSGLDQDEFDLQCHHLYVRHLPTGEVIGTYRLQTQEMAELHQGFYSATVFDLATAPPDMLKESVELGRACIHADHRSLTVLHLLWKGIGLFSRCFGKKYLFGCCSLTSQNEEEGLQVLRYLENHDHIHPEISILPLKTHQFSESHQPNQAVLNPPRLMRAYLSLGAKICSSPAIDQDFKTIDFLALFDVSSFNSTDSAFYLFQS
jgi:putative hemolysin